MLTPDPNQSCGPSNVFEIKTIKMWLTFIKHRNGILYEYSKTQFKNIYYILKAAHKCCDAQAHICTFLLIINYSCTFLVIIIKIICIINFGQKRYERKHYEASKVKVENFQTFLWKFVKALKYNSLLILTQPNIGFDQIKSFFLWFLSGEVFTSFRKSHYF